MDTQLSTRQANYFNTVLPIMQACEIINKETSEILKPSVYDKLVYCYILHYHNLYKAAGSNMYESQDSIADNLCMDRKTVNRSIKKLCDIGLITKNVHLEVKGNVKRKHAVYNPYDVSLGDRFIFKQNVVVRDDKGFGQDCSFLYGIVPVQKRETPSVSVPEKKEVVTKELKAEEPPEGHPAIVEIPDDEEFEQIRPQRRSFAEMLDEQFN